MGPVAGTISRTARAATVRWGLKEAAGKLLARRTGIVYEAVMPDEKAIIFEVPKLPGRHGRIYGGHKQEGRCALPGEICMFATGYHYQEVMGWAYRSQQKA